MIVLYDPNIDAEYLFIFQGVKRGVARHVSTVKIDDDDLFFSEFLEFLEDFRRRRVPRAGDGLVTGLRAGDGSDGDDDGHGVAVGGGGGGDGGDSRDDGGDGGDAVVGDGAGVDGGGSGDVHSIGIGVGNGGGGELGGHRVVAIFWRD